jgi:hypothetical protein
MLGYINEISSPLAFLPFTFLHAGIALKIHEYGHDVFGTLRFSKEKSKRLMFLAQFNSRLDKGVDVRRC